MRRVQKERTDPAFMVAVLQEAEECVLGLTGPDGPYVVPVNFVYIDGKLYFHCAQEGHKLDLLQADPRVAFTVYTGVEVLPDVSSTAYRSVCGNGRGVILEDREEKRAALDAIARRFMADCPLPTPDAAVDSVAVVRVDIEVLTGKCSTGPGA